MPIKPVRDAYFGKVLQKIFCLLHPHHSTPSQHRHKGKGTVERVLSTHCVGHSHLAAHYKYQSWMIERCWRAYKTKNRHTLNPSHFRLCRASGGKLRILLLKSSVWPTGNKSQSTGYQADALTDTPSAGYTKPSTLRMKPKPGAAPNPGPVCNDPAYWPIRHAAVAGTSTIFLFSHFDRALSFSVIPLRNMRPGSNPRVCTDSNAFNLYV